MIRRARRWLAWRLRVLAHDLDRAARWMLP